MTAEQGGSREVQQVSRLRRQKRGRGIWLPEANGSKVLLTEMMGRRQRIKRFGHRKDGHDGGADIGVVSLDV